MAKLVVRLDELREVLPIGDDLHTDKKGAQIEVLPKKTTSVRDKDDVRQTEGSIRAIKPCGVTCGEVLPIGHDPHFSKIDARTEVLSKKTTSTSDNNGVR